MNITKELPIPEFSELLDSLRYIEKVRAWGLNKGKKRRMSRELTADLYFAGHPIVKMIRNHGSANQIQALDKLIKDFEICFN